MNSPKYATIAVTYRCNSRCKMCNIWKKPPENELKPADFNRLPKNLDDVNLTGGEPSLRSDLDEIIDVIIKRSSPKRIVISSNGFLTSAIVDLAQKIMAQNYSTQIDFAFSMDGIGEKHNEVRGVPSAFVMVTKTIEELQKIGFKNIGLGYTFVAGNEAEYERVVAFAQEKGIKFGATIAHNADNYFSTQDNEKIDAKIVEEQVNKNIDEKIKGFSKNELGKSYYLHGLIHYAKTGKQLVPCDALFGSFFMDSTGNIYPCNILSSRIGNLLEDDFENIWNSHLADKVRCTVKNCPTPCWMVCTAKPGIKKRWIKVGAWILKKKLQRYFK